MFLLDLFESDDGPKRSEQYARIILNAKRGLIESWENFVSKYPGGSIALDGFVSGPTKIDEKGPHGNFNHHEGVDRLSVRATCSQVLLYIRQGILDVLNQDGVDLNLRVNDPDEDTSLSVWLFENYIRFLSHLTIGFDEVEQNNFGYIFANVKEKIKDFSNILFCKFRKICGMKKKEFDPSKIDEYIEKEGFTMVLRLSRLVLMEDHLDTTGGFLKVNLDSKMFRQMVWIFKEFTDMKISGKIVSLTDEDIINIIREINKKITMYVLGFADEHIPNTDYEEIGGGDLPNGNTSGGKRKLIVEKGAYARIKLANEGINAFVSVRKALDDKGERNGRYIYTLGKRFPFVKFPINDLYELLNNAEGIPSDCSERWGGSNIIGGSPRKFGSRLDPNQVEKIINDFLSKR